MAHGIICTCPGQRNDRMKNWFVINRNCHHSAFNGYKRTWSPFSQVTCNKCKHVWRTKSNYVSSLRDGKFNE